jgi:hypothetical protein
VLQTRASSDDINDNGNGNGNGDDRVKVDFFVMSKCPDARL